MIIENKYRSRACGEVSEGDIGQVIRVAGWVENIRDHGGILFIDLRDQYGVVQVVIPNDSLLEGVRKETVVTIEGEVTRRDPETGNPALATGTAQVRARTLEPLGERTEALPFEIGSSTDTKEEIRLQYRFLDLRNKKVKDKIILRSQVISFLRSEMERLGFTEIQTPILTASSPEGARDYLVPSRKHPGKFYALPQAPQQFKQLLMVAGFDRYFQIAPCFRDEDSRADRSPGEFYQLDFEMAFATQEEVFAVAEEVLSSLFSRFSDKKVDKAPFPRIRYDEAMLRFGSDKPDLRNPLRIIDLSDLFVETDFKPFRGQTVRAIPVPDCAGQPRSFFEQMLGFAEGIGMKGLGYVKVNDDMTYAGPIDKFLSDEQRAEIARRGELKPGYVLYFIADEKDTAPKLAGQIRTELGRRLGLIDEDSFRMCFVVDFPMYELDEETGEIVFTHNPFSMPEGGLEALNTRDPLTIYAQQYDIVCNGVELSSGAVRNHDVDTLVRAFEIAGYDRETMIAKFPALYNAFHYGAPPHAGMAPGIDRMVMLLAGEENIREVIAFPMNSNAQDLLMGAPNEVTEQQLREVHIKLRSQQ